MMELTAYVPIEKVTIAKYLAPVLSVAQARTKPITAIVFAIVICQVRSLRFPELIDQRIEMMPAIRYGGHVRTLHVR